MDGTNSGIFDDGSLATRAAETGRKRKTVAGRADQAFAVNEEIWQELAQHARQHGLTAVLFPLPPTAYANN